MSDLTPERYEEIVRWHMEYHYVDVIEQGEESEDTRILGELLRHIDAITPRVISTSEELDALPQGAVVRDALDAVSEKSATPHHLPWRVVGSRLQIGTDGITLPAVVLHVPQEEA